MQETAQRICAANGVPLADANVLWAFDLPQLANPLHIAELCAGIESNEIEVLILDPLYLCLMAGPLGSSLDAANLFHTGPLFRQLAKAVHAVGCTPILLHHATKHIPPGEPMELGSLAYSGVAEFARQWLLLNRREHYDPANEGIHNLWLGVGGSTGQCGLSSREIDEGSLLEDFSGRKWEVLVTGASQARQTEQEQKQSKAAGMRLQKDHKDDTAFMDALDQLAGSGEPTTRKSIESLAGLPRARMKRATERLLAAKVIERKPFMVEVGNGAKRAAAGFRRKEAGNIVLAF